MSTNPHGQSWDPPVGGDCRYFLARMTGPMDVKLVDGCHSDPTGVAKAAKLLARIFGDSGPWVMVKVEDAPDLDVPINEQAASTCARLVAGEFKP